MKKQSPFLHPYLFAGLSENLQLASRVGIGNSDPAYIISGICRAFEIDAVQLMSKTHQRKFVELRAIAIGLIFKTNPGITTVELGRVFKRDHSTIIYNKQLYNNLYKSDKTFTEKVELVLASI